MNSYLFNEDNTDAVDHTLKSKYFHKKYTCYTFTQFDSQYGSMDTLCIEGLDMNTE